LTDDQQNSAPEEDSNSSEGPSVTVPDTQLPAESDPTSDPELSDAQPSDAATEQPGTAPPLEVLPPDAAVPPTTSSEKPPSDAPSLLDPVTLVPNDRWTWRTSINNRTEQECVNRLFTCPMRPFHARWSLMGEMFVDE